MENEETPPSETEELRNLIANVKEVLKGKSNYQILKIFHRIVDELVDTTTHFGTGKLLGHFDDTSELSNDNHDKSDEILIPPAALKLSNGKSRLDEETHPMHSDLILKTIFEYCSVNTLMNCRLVCKKWLNLSLKLWRQKALLVTDELINQNAVEELVKDGSEYRQTPFKCYDVVDYESDSDNFELKNKILNTFGPSIQYFDFDCDDLKLGMSLIFSKLPDLRNLKMRFYYDSFVNEWQDDLFQSIPKSTAFSKVTKLQLCFAILLPRNRDQLDGIIQWSKFFERIPSLTSLHVKYRLESFYSGGKRVHYRILREILQAVQKVRESENFTTLNLEDLDIMIHANHSCISIPFSKKNSDIIIQSRLPLERLSIDIGITDNASCVADLLAPHGETLKYLKAISAPDKYYLKKKLTLGPFLVNKVSLPKLTELELLNGCVWAFHFTGSLEVPKLEVLRIEEMKLKQHRRFEKLSWKSVDANCREKHMTKILDPLHFPNLKRFYYSGPRHLSSNELQLLANAMPCVTDLGLPLSAKTFPVVCEIWSGLKSLRVGQVFEGAYPFIDDYTITGLPLEDNLSKSARVKNITDLKELWSFELDGNSGESYSRIAMITDTSVVLGFRLLPKLTVLRIGAICKFSSVVKKTLERHVSDVTINERRAFNVEENNRNSSDSSDDESELESVYSEPDSG